MNFQKNIKQVLNGVNEMAKNELSKWKRAHPPIMLIKELNFCPMFGLREMRGKENERWLECTVF